MANITIKLNGGLKKLLAKSNLKYNEVSSGFIDTENGSIAQKLEFGGLYPIDEEYRQRGLNAGIELGDSLEIPPRPFMQYTFDEYSKTWVHNIKDDIISTNYDFKEVLKKQGVRMKFQIQNTMRDHDLYEDNGIKIQKIKGKNTPLLDSGHLINSVEYKIL